MAQHTGHGTTEAYTRLLLDELVPATGCTEPIAVALAAARAREVLDAAVEQVTVRCSGNIVKNAMSVVVPNTGGRAGIPMAAAVGVVGADAALGLRCLEPVTSDDVSRAEALVEARAVKVELVRGVAGLYIAVDVAGGGHTATAELRGDHSRFTTVTRDGVDVPGAVEARPEVAPPDAPADAQGDLDPAMFTLDRILDHAESLDFDAHPDLRDALDRQAGFNTAIADEGLKNSYGAQIGRTYLALHDDSSARTRARGRAAAGSDARMGGSPMPVMINSGSGNQGITISVPVVEYARELGASEDALRRALVVANLLALYQKSCIGRLSAFCGVVTAAAASGAAVAWLKGLSRAQIGQVLTTAVATNGGMVCDGAKPSCASKISVSLESALSAVELAERGLGLQPHDGIVGDDVDATIRNVGRIASQGMAGTDIEILQVMLEK